MFQFDIFKEKKSTKVHYENQMLGILSVEVSPWLYAFVKTHIYAH